VFEKHGLNASSTSNFAFFSLLHDELILADNNLSGSIPSELLALPNIRSSAIWNWRGIIVSKWIW